MTLATLMPYLLVVAGWLLRHYDILGKLLALLGGTNPLTGPAPAKPLPSTSFPLPTVSLGNHPVLSDAVSAAIKQAVSDAVTGHMTSVKGEIGNAVSSAVAAAVADLKAKV